MGELSALTSAAFWASASVIYAHYVKNISAIILNFAKGILAVLFIYIAVLILPQYSFGNIKTDGIIILLVAGSLGIGLGDSFYFVSLRFIGARLSLLIQLSSPPLAAMFAFILYEEKISFVAVSGIFITLLGISWVLTEKNENVIKKVDLLKGILFSAFASVSSALGIVYAHNAMQVHTQDPMVAAFYRLMGGNLVLIVLIFFRLSKTSYSNLFKKRTFSFIALASFFGTFISIWLQQVALQKIPAGIAQTLFSTSPLFVIPISVFMGERITPRSVLGVLFSIVGIYILFVN